MNVFENQLKIAFKDVDASGKMTPFAVFDCFQEASEAHAEIIGVGRDFMLAQKQVWVLSRMSVRVEKRPRLDALCALKTLPCGFEKLFCLRDYSISGAGGEVFVKARSGWLILDMASRRPLRPQSLSVPIPRNEGLEIMSGVPGVPDFQGELKEAAVREAAYSDIDFNSHMNNARYIQWIQDVLDYDALRGSEKFDIDINYLSETRRGDVIRLMKGGADGAVFIEGRKIEGGGETAVFRARVALS